MLSALSESNCCGENAWNRRQYYAWVAEYLTTLWRNSAPAPTPGTISSLSGVSATGAGIDQEVSPHLLVNQVLPVLRTVFEYDANMGLSVLVNTKTQARGASSDNRTAADTGGQGVALEDVSTPLPPLTCRIWFCFVILVFSVRHAPPTFMVFNCRLFSSWAICTSRGRTVAPQSEVSLLCPLPTAKLSRLPTCLGWWAPDSRPHQLTISIYRRWYM